MAKPNPSQNYFRLGPVRPVEDPWGKGAWDSACDLYSIPADDFCVPVTVPQIHAPIVAGGSVPQFMVGFRTPPCDRFALYCVHMKPDSNVTPGTGVPANWIINLRRGVDCMAENNSVLPIANYKPTAFDDFGLIMQLAGSPLSTDWEIWAQQSVAGAQVPFSMRIRVIADRIGACCVEDVQPGPNTSGS
jgi:hypothetical protein